MPEADAVISIQRDNFLAISRINRNLGKDSKERHCLAYFEARLERVQELWTACQSQHAIILATIDVAKRKSYDDEFEQIEELHLDLVTKLKTGVQEYKNKAGVCKMEEPRATMKNQVRLERLTIPKFDGCYGNWRMFNDLFNSLVHHNETLSEVEKMQYLKTHLTGEAARSIQHMDITNENYPVAIELLRKRYENKRAIAWNYLHKFHKLPTAKEERDSVIKHMMDTTAELIANMEGIGINTEHWDVLIIFTLSQKLDTQSRKLWEASLGSSGDIPKLGTFIDFLTSRFRALEALDTPKRPNKVEAFTVREATRCNICSKSHYTNQCNVFKELNTHKRKILVKEKKLCFNCLRSGHLISQCPSKSRCRTCSLKHHTLLHDREGNEQTKGFSIEAKPFIPVAKSLTATEIPSFATQTSIMNSSSAVVANQSETSDYQHVLLGTARVQLENSSGELIVMRALVDSGSQRSFITESAAQLLGLKRSAVKTQVCGIGASSKVQLKGSVSFNMRPRIGKDAINVKALIIPKITNLCPSIEMQVTPPKCISASQLADPFCGTPGRVDVLLGADVFHLIILSGVKNGNPCAINTKLGWILLGPTAATEYQLPITSLVGTEEQTDELIRKFWEISEIPTKPNPTPEENSAEEWYRKTTTRQSSGRYIVRLPFKEKINAKQTLKGSQSTVHIRFSQLEKRLVRDENLGKQYRAFMDEYIQLGHMVEIPPQEINSSYNYYLPHHAVCKEDSTTTKLRVVFNASQATPSGQSLNDLLLIGPTVQNNLINILMRWRTFRYVLVADIEKMYRQITIHPEDQDYQRILWRNHPSESVKHFRLTTVTYGTACAPYLAIRTLHQLAEDEKIFHPRASKSILQDFYVDDLLTGGNTIEEVKILQHDLITVMKKGGFKLRKWAANHDFLLAAIPESDREIQLPLDFEETGTIKTLGLRWHPARDVFSFKVNLEQISSSQLTKRQLLSEIAKLYDPVGWLQPCIVVGKIMMQQIWVTKTNWDEQIPTEFDLKWRKFRSQLPVLQEITIPRWMQYNGIDSTQIHGFCDASEVAYAAVIYLRIEHVDGTTSVSLLTSRSKVAPLKIQSIPRLELCGAALLCDVMKATVEAHGWTHIKPHFWTDSTIVLQWLQSPAARWKPFVANRVSKIQSESETKQWDYVNSKSNPADIASRGTFPLDLVQNSLWWNGPSWLKDNPTKWPKISSKLEHAMAKTEKRSSNPVLLVANTNQQPRIFEKFSSLTKLIRVYAYCRRWITKSKGEFLSSMELRQAEISCIRVIQQEAYSEEIKALKAKKPVSKSSSLIRLTPIIDADQLLRVGGRLGNCNINEDSKHQIIIPRGHFANLIIRHYHHLSLHGPHKLVHSNILQKYWIINGMTAVKTFTRKCVTCFKVNARPSWQLMGSLPRERVQPGKPFAKTGLDYAGPLTIKWSGGRGTKTTKAYIAVFVCLSTKAVHLELASDLTSKTCIAAIRRFIARRGMCHTLVSDNGTNFVGADRMLREAAKRMVVETQATLATNSIEWKFIPPGSPHFGGIWEAAVKSMKRHMIKVVGSHLLNVEEMYTFLAQIEACLNSRPLTPLSTDPNDLAALTPGHFLTGANLFELPNEIAEDNVTKKWQLVQRLKQHFWQRWSLEYLTQLQQRSKWFTENRKIRVNDLILIKYENYASTKWPLGRIIALHPGEDALARVATIKTIHGSVKRSISKICPLPINDDVGNHENPATRSASPKNDDFNHNQSSTSTNIDPNSDPPLNHMRPDTGSNQLNFPENQQNLRGSSTSKYASRAKLSNAMITLLALLICVAPGRPNYTITRPNAGMYVEHVGMVQLLQGQLKLTIEVSATEIATDISNVEEIVANATRLCNASRKLHSESRCGELVQQLHNMKERVLDIMRPWVRTRSRRGILGSVLQGIFGVNDEVYKDIDKLDENQRRLIEGTQQQGHLLLTTRTFLNDTRHTLTTKLNIITEGYNHLSRTLNEMSSWYKTTDQNHIDIQFLTAYQLAFGWLEQIQHQYKIFHSLNSGSGNIVQACSPRTLVNTLAVAQGKLGNTLHIEPRQMGRSYATISTTGIQFTGFFPIIEQREFELIYCTGIPQSLGDSKYSITDLPNTHFGIRYDDQIYFELTSDHLAECEVHSPGKRYCTVNPLLSISDHPNCVLDEIYDRLNKTHCPQHIFQVDNFLWKQLARPNTWLFLATKPNSLALTCNGHREDIRVQGVGIMEINPHCSIKSATAIIRANLQMTKDILIHPTYIKPISSLQEVINHTSHVFTPLKSILQQDETFIPNDQHREAALVDMHTATWRHLRSHTIILGSSIGLVFFVTCVIISFLIWIIRTRNQPSNINSTESAKWYEPNK